MKNIFYLIPFLYITILSSTDTLSSYAVDHGYTNRSIIERAKPPYDLCQKLNELFKNKELINAFVKRENIITNAQRLALTHKYSMTKIANYNYVFRTPLLPGFILKLGPIHYTYSLGGQAIRIHETTNKNVSRVAYQQLILDVIQKNKLQHIRVVKKYLYSVSDNMTLCDENFIVVAEDIQNILLDFKENLEKFKTITDEQLEELRIIAYQAFIADLKPENCIFGTDGFIYLIDTEQTNKAKETDFFLNNSERMALDRAIGVQHVNDFKKLQDDTFFALYLLKTTTNYEYSQMGIEPDDKPTISAESIKIRDDARL